MTGRRGLVSTTRSTLVSLVLAATTIGLVACGSDTSRDGTARPANVTTRGDGYAGTLVTDPPMRPAEVTLRDTRGALHPLDQVGDEGVTALFFGFTHCDDVCPTTMADLAAARRALPASLAQRVEVVFVTVDPRRDTARVLDRWLGRFDPSFVGLRGPVVQVHQLEDSLYAAQSAVDESTGGPGHHHGDSGGGPGGAEGYEVSHSGSVYVFGPGGRSLLYTGGTTPAEYAADFTRLLGSS